MSNNILIALGISLLLTLLLEVGFYLAVCKRNKKDLLLVVLVNMLTNPIVVLLYWMMYWYTNWNTTVIKIPLELFAIVVEGLYYKKYSAEVKRPLIFSLSANIFSFSTGVLLQQFIL